MPQIGLVIDGGDQFFRPIERELGQHYQVRRFAPRFVKAPVVGTSVNKLLLHLQLSGFLRRYDLVFFEWAGSLLVRATQMPKTCKIVARLHSVEVVTAAHLVDWSRVDATIVPSGHMKRRLLQVAGVSPPSLYVVNYGVDLARFQPVARTFKHRIGMVCAVLPIKRVYEAILCVADLVRQGHPFKLEVAGRLDNERVERYPWAVRELIEKLDLTDRITLHGHLDDPSQFYHDVGIFLSNSYWEGQQVALLEAMASGCFCLSHFWGGVEEVLPAEKIYTTDADLRAKLLAYVALPEARRQRAQARMRAIAEERFDERRMVGEILGLIEGAVGE